MGNISEARELWIETACDFGDAIPFLSQEQKMDPSLERVISEDKIRYTVLRKLYEKAGPVTDSRTLYSDLVTEEEFNENKVCPTVEYLKNENLIDVDWNGREDPILSITHKGIKEVEQSIRQPKESTEHFSPKVIQHFHGPVGAVQAGNDNTANVTQHNSLDISKALKLIQEIRQHRVSLPQEEQQEVIEQLDDFETEIKLDNPKPSRLKASVQVLLDLAGSTATAAGFVDAVHSLSEWLPGFIQSFPTIGGN